MYHEAIPSVIEFGPERKLDASALRELRKRLDRQDTDPADANSIADECMNEIVELSSGTLRHLFILLITNCLSGQC